MVRWVFMAALLFGVLLWVGFGLVLLLGCVAVWGRLWAHLLVGMVVRLVGFWALGQVFVVGEPVSAVVGLMRLVLWVGRHLVWGAVSLEGVGVPSVVSMVLVVSG